MAGRIAQKYYALPAARRGQEPAGQTPTSRLADRPRRPKGSASSNAIAAHRRPRPGEGPEGARDANGFPGSDIGARINAAIESLPAAGGRVVIPAGAYRFSTTIVIDRPVWLEGQAAGATTLRYTGARDAILVEAGGATPYLNGGISGLTLVGNSGPDAVGVHQVDTIGYSYRDLAIEHFTGANSAGIWMDNQPPSYCPNCAAGDSERTRWDRVSFFENTVGLEFSNGGGTSSFEYSWMWASHFQINNGQTGIWLAGTGPGSIALQHSDMNFMANICLTEPTGAAGTVASVTGGAGWYQGFVHAAAEQSCGRTPGTMWDVGAGSYVDAWGDYAAAPLTNHVATGGTLIFGLYGPTQVWGPTHVATKGNLSVPLGVGGRPAPNLAGAGDIALAGKWLASGQLNESLGFGGDTRSGAALAGLGFDYGFGIQHPLSWCYAGDATRRCFAWFAKNGPATPLTGTPGAWLSASPDWEFFADSFGSKAANPARSGTLRLASGDTIDWRNSAGTRDLALAKNAADQLDLSAFSGLIVPGKLISGGATVLLPATGGALALASQLPLAAATGRIGGSLLKAGECAGANVSVGGATTAMAVLATPVTYPGDGFYWEGYVSAAGTVTVKLCAARAGTPEASKYNVRVIR